MLYDILKICVSICFNLLNRLLGGKLPPFGCACVVVERDGMYLTVKLPRGRTVFPGGFMTWREQPRQTAEREGREETGLLLRTTGLVGVYSHASASLIQMSNINFVYRAEVVGGTLRKNMEGQPCWLNESDLRKRLDAGGLRILDDYLQYHAQQAAHVTTSPEQENTATGLAQTGNATI